MNIMKKIQGSSLVKTAIIIVGVSGLVIAPNCFARGDKFDGGLLIGGMIGLMAGAAIASSARPYQPAYQSSYYPDYYPSSYSCKRVIKKCRIRYGYYGPEKVCYKVVRRVC